MPNLPNPFSTALWHATLEPAWISPGVSAAPTSPTSALISADGGPLRADSRLWVAWWRAQIQESLNAAVQRPVILTALPEQPETWRPVLSVRISDRARNRAWAFAFDSDATRLLANAMQSRFVSLRGDGPLTAAEVGLIEFAILECIDAICVAQPDLTGGLLLESMLTGIDPATALLQRGSAGVVFHRVRIGGREGLIAAALPANWGMGEEVVNAPGAATTSERPTSVVDLQAAELTLGLATPCFAIAEDEVAGLVQGDCVLAGLADLSGALGCRVVTSTHWSLGPANDVMDSPTHIVATVAAATWPRIESDFEVPEGCCAAWLRIGSLAVPLQHVMTLGTPRQLSFAKAAGREAALVVRGKDVVRGELCRVDGEIAMRVLERFEEGGAA